MEQYQVQIVRASNLQAADKSGTSDPYVKFSKRFQNTPKGKQTWKKTKVVKKNLNPEWHESNAIENIDIISDQQIILEFEVWDKDTFGKDFLGTAMVEAENLWIYSRKLNGKVVEVAVPLKTRQYKLGDRVSGSIILRVAAMSESMTSNDDIPFFLYGNVAIDWSAYSIRYDGVLPIVDDEQIVALAEYFRVFPDSDIFTGFVFNYLKFETSRQREALSDLLDVTKNWAETVEFVTTMGLDLTRAYNECISKENIKNLKVGGISTETLVKVINDLPNLESIIVDNPFGMNQLTDEAIDAVINHPHIKRFWYTGTLQIDESKVETLVNSLESYKLGSHIHTTPEWFTNSKIKALSGTFTSSVICEILNANVIEVAYFELLGTDIDAMCQAFQSNTSLKSLTIKSMASDVSNEDLLDSIFALPNLEHVNFSHIDVNMLFDRVVKSTTMKYFSGPYNFPVSLFTNLLEQNEHLLYAVVDASEGEVDDQTRNAVHNHPNLRFAKLGTCPSFYEDPMQLPRDKINPSALDVCGLVEEYSFHKSKKIISGPIDPLILGL